MSQIPIVSECSHPTDFQVTRIGDFFDSCNSELVSYISPDQALLLSLRWRSEFTRLMNNDALQSATGGKPFKRDCIAEVNRIKALVDSVRSETNNPSALLSIDKIGTSFPRSRQRS